MNAMNIRMRRLGIVFGLAIALAPVAKAEDVRAVAAAVDAHYNHLRGLSRGRCG
jgi:hypothetical protein